MFRSRTSNNMINKIHERALRLILNDHTIYFDTLSQNNNDTCNHYKNIQTLIAEIYKIKNNPNPPIMALCFKGEISRIVFEIFKSLRRKKEEL